MAVKALNETTEIRVLNKVMPLAPPANSLDVIWVAPDVAADGVKFLQTGREVVFVRNTDVGAQTFTLKSVADELNRVGDVGAYSLDPDEGAAILINNVGFKDSSGYVTIVMSNVGVEVAVFRTPGQL